MSDRGDRPIRVTLLGGHPVVRGVVAMACREAPDLELVPGALDDGDVQAVARSDADVAVVDLDARRGDGAWMIRDLRSAGFDGRVLVLTDRGDGAAVLEALRHGADGCLVTAAGLRGIASVVRRVAGGERIVDPDLEASAMRHLGRYVSLAREGSAAAAALTARERQVLSMLVEGQTMRQMGRRLGISPRTVERHIAGVYRKLDVHTRVQAVRRAAALDLIDIR